MESEGKFYPADEVHEIDPNKDKADVLTRIGELEDKKESEGLSDDEEEMLQTLKETNELVE